MRRPACRTVGQLDSTGKGTFTGTETESDNGTIYNDVAVSGTYSIAANCTGSGTITNPKNGSQAHYNFSADLVGKQLDAVCENFAQHWMKAANHVNRSAVKIRFTDDSKRNRNLFI